MTRSTRRGVCAFSGSAAAGPGTSVASPQRRLEATGSAAGEVPTIAGSNWSREHRIRVTYRTLHSVSRRVWSLFTLETPARGSYRVHIERPALPDRKWCSNGRLVSYRMLSSRPLSRTYVVYIWHWWSAARAPLGTIASRSLRDARRDAEQRWISIPVGIVRVATISAVPADLLARALALDGIAATRARTGE